VFFAVSKAQDKGMNSFTDLLTLAQSEQKTWIVNYQTPAIYR